MKFTYGSKMIDFDAVPVTSPEFCRTDIGAELTFTKIENTKANGVACVFSDSKGETIKLTQQEVEQALSLLA